MYQIYPSKHFDREYRKIAKNNKLLNELILNTIFALRKDPFSIGLRTHLVNSFICKDAYSSRVSKDTRIIWIFDQYEKGILLLSIGGHSGSKKVYK